MARDTKVEKGEDQVQYITMRAGPLGKGRITVGYAADPSQSKYSNWPHPRIYIRGSGCISEPVWIYAVMMH